MSTLLLCTSIYYFNNMHSIDYLNMYRIETKRTRLSCPKY